MLRIEPEHRVLDVACGIGASAVFLSKEFGCDVVGVDISMNNCREAVRKSRISEEGASDDEFVVGHSSRLPIACDSVDVGILECVLSSFREKEIVLRELRRVLKSGGRIGITDVTVDGELPAELDVPVMQQLCVSGALSMNEYSRLLNLSGFAVVEREDKKEEMVEFLEGIRRKLFVAQLLSGVGKIAIKKDDVKYAKRLVDLARDSAREDKLGYAFLVGQSVG